MDNFGAYPSKNPHFSALMRRTYSHNAALSLFWVATATALILPRDSSGSLVVSTPYNLSTSELGLLSSFNSSATASDIRPMLNETVPEGSPQLNDAQIRCSFSRELEHNDCLDALNTFTYPRNRNLTIGQRLSGGRVAWDLDLPVRWLSGNLSIVSLLKNSTY